MKRKLLLTVLFIFSLFFGSLPAKAVDDSFQKNMTRDFSRGFKNLLSFPLDVPRTMGEYHKSSQGRPVVKDFAGFFDGTFRAFTRATSGLGDFLAAFLPGQQEGWPVEPETLF